MNTNNKANSRQINFLSSLMEKKDNNQSISIQKEEPKNKIFSIVDHFKDSREKEKKYYEDRHNAKYYRK